MSTMSEDQTYSGWKNYATWGVALVLDNDQGLYEACREVAADYSDPDNISPQEADGIWTHEQAARFQLEDYIKELVEELCYSEDLSLMQQQVIQSGLAEVDWTEVAGHYFED